MRIRHHHGFGHGLSPGTDRDINCGSCKQEQTDGTTPRITGCVTYDHPELGTITARPVTDQTTQADWIACDVDSRDGVNRVFGYVVDLRADCGGQPSEISDPNPDAKSYDAFSVAGRYIMSTHSLTGALAAVGQRYRNERPH